MAKHAPLSDSKLNNRPGTQIYTKIWTNPILFIHQLKLTRMISICMNKYATAQSRPCDMSRIYAQLLGIGNME